MATFPKPQFLSIKVTSNMEMTSDFATVFNDSNPVKMALAHYTDKFIVSEKDTNAKPNFISMSPHYRTCSEVPAECIPQVMDLLNKCYNKNLWNHFYEVQDVNKNSNGEPVSGLVFEFKFDTDENRVAFDTVVQAFIKRLFHDILQQCVKFSKEKETHYCFYLASPKPVFDPRTLKYRSYFRVVIPSIMLTPDVRFYINVAVYRSTRIQALFKQRLNGRTVRKSFQRSMRSSPVTLLGSCTPDQEEPLNIVSVYAVYVEEGKTDGDSFLVNDIFKTFPNLVADLSISHPTSPDSIVQKKAYDVYKECFDELHRILEKPEERFQLEYDVAMSDYVKLSVYDKRVTYVHDYLKLLDKVYFTDIDKWYEVIKSLASVGPKYKCLAIVATMERNKRLVEWDEFVEYWESAINNANRKKYSINTLRFWASSSSPSKMQCYINNTIQKMIVRDIRDPILEGFINHSQVAEYLYFMYGNDYLTCKPDGRNMTWFEFVTPDTSDVSHGQIYKWRSLGERPDAMIEFMSSDFTNIAKAVHKDLHNQLIVMKSNKSDSEDDSKSDIQRVSKLLNNFKKSIRGVNTIGFKDSSIKEAMSKFRRNAFMEDLDRVSHIMGVGNGVIEFNGPDVKLLDHYHTYPISLYTDTNYIEYDEDNFYIQEVYRFLRSLFIKGEEDAMDFLLYYFSTSLDWLPKESLFLIVHGGGCHAINTPIRMFDGSIKMVQDVTVGDKLMGDDNTPRVVQELFRGEDEMFRVSPIKGESFVVNKDHVLSLKFTNMSHIEKRTDGVYADCPKYRAVWHVLNGENEPKRRSKIFSTKKEASDYLTATAENAIKKGDIIDIKVKNLMKWSPWWLKKGNVSLYRPSTVEYSTKNLAIDPYVIGYWLGDGTTRTSQFTTMDDEVVDAISEKLDSSLTITKYATTSGCKASTYRINQRGTRHNSFLDEMKDLNLIGNKHVPEEFKTSSKKQRLELLAGMLDADGYYNPTMRNYELTLKLEGLIDDFIEIARSLGLAAYKTAVQKTATNGANGPVTGTYYRTHIYGEGLEQIPCRLARKQAAPHNKLKDARVSNFILEPVGRGNYYGFELDGNHRYLTGDFIVHHNSNGKSVLMELFRATLGNKYARKMQLSFITDLTTSKSSSADPSVMDLQYARLVYYSESEKNERVNVAKIKELTGGETISGRQLYGEQKNFNVNCNHIVTTNYRFSIQTTDHAVWRRFMSYRFKLCFVKGEPTKPNERARDTEFTDRIKTNKRYHEAFLSILVHYRSKLYSDYGGRILKVPHPTIERETEEYRQSEDIYQRYIMQKVYYYQGRQQHLEQMVNNFRNYCLVENGSKINELTANLIHIFRNSTLQPHIIEEGGIHMLDNLYTIDDKHETVEPGSILFSEWVKRAQTTSES